MNNWWVRQYLDVLRRIPSQLVMIVYRMYIGSSYSVPGALPPMYNLLVMGVTILCISAIKYFQYTIQ